MTGSRSLKVSVDQERCQGHARCHALAPELFALDELGNAMLFALSRRVQDRIVIAARRQQLTAAGELRAGDPGLPLQAQAAVHRLASAESIGVTVTGGQVLHPLKSMSMVLGIGIDLPPARWSRCDDCLSAPKCRMSGRVAAAAML